MKPGTRPRPTALKILLNTRRSRVNRDEPQPPAPDASTFDTPPPELDGETVAAAEWRRLAPMLRQARQITEADRSALIAACLEWGRYIDATKKTQTLGPVVTGPNGYPMTNPFLSIAARALAACNKLWPELGLTPSSRSRVTAAGPLPSPGQQETTVARLQREGAALRQFGDFGGKPA
jgi:P27 family predicted phage terminase small subunit